MTEKQRRGGKKKSNCFYTGINNREEEEQEVTTGRSIERSREEHERTTNNMTKETEKTRFFSCVRSSPSSSNNPNLSIYLSILSSSLFIIEENGLTRLNNYSTVIKRK